MPSLNLVLTPIDVEKRKALDFHAGDTVRVWQKVKEGGKTRLQAFDGLVLARKHGAESGATFTVRKIAAGVGVERVFPLFSPDVDKVEIKARAKKVRRAKIYYVRNIAQREIRRKMKQVFEDARIAAKSRLDAEQVTKQDKEEKSKVVDKETA
ncbi:MAG: 50S ribosomal protein L19 [Patescibacteria group bacterium]